jgi:hypothetical protein
MAEGHLPKGRVPGGPHTDKSVFGTTLRLAAATSGFGINRCPRHL